MRIVSWEVKLKQVFTAVKDDTIRIVCTIGEIEIKESNTFNSEKLQEKENHFGFVRQKYVHKSCKFARQILKQKTVKKA